MIMLDFECKFRKISENILIFAAKAAKITCITAKKDFFACLCMCSILHLSEIEIIRNKKQFMAIQNYYVTVAYQLYVKDEDDEKEALVGAV